MDQNMNRMPSVWFVFHCGKFFVEKEERHLAGHMENYTERVHFESHLPNGECCQSAVSNIEDMENAPPESHIQFAMNFMSGIFSQQNTKCVYIIKTLTVCIVSLLACDFEQFYFIISIVQKKYNYWIGSTVSFSCNTAEEHS